MYKRTGFVLLLLAIILILAYVTSGPLFYGAFYIFLALIIMGFIWTRNMKKIDVSVHLDTSLSQVGTTIKLTVKIKNNSIFPVTWGQCWIEMPAAFELPDHLACYLFSAKPGEVVTIEDDLLCRRRGCFKWGHVFIRTGDPLGLFIHTETFGFDHFLKIRPGLVNLNYKFRSQPESEDWNMRKYVPGDALSGINWKVSARMQQLFIREWRPGSNSDIFIYLDNHPESNWGHGFESSFETAAAIAASLGSGILKKGLGVRVYTRDSGHDEEKIYKPYEPGSLDAFLDWLTLAGMTGDGAYPQILKKHHPSGIYLITGIVDDKALELLMKYQKGGCRCTLFLLKPQGSESGGSLDVPEIKGVKIIQVDHKSVLSDILRREGNEGG